MRQLLQNDMKKNNWECKKCSSVMKTQDNLKQHMKFQHFESSYQCEECIRSFETERKLQGHKEKIHGENPKISCQLCSELFRTKSDMKKHKRLIHKDSESHCNQCEKSFQGPYSVLCLERHIDQVMCSFLILEIFCKLPILVFLFVVQMHMKSTNQNFIYSLENTRKTSTSIGLYS